MLQTNDSSDGKEMGSIPTYMKTHTTETHFLYVCVSMVQTHTLFFFQK